MDDGAGQWTKRLMTQDVGRFAESAGLDKHRRKIKTPAIKLSGLARLKMKNKNSKTFEFLRMK